MPWNLPWTAEELRLKSEEEHRKAAISHPRTEYREHCTACIRVREWQQHRFDEQKKQELSSST